MRFTQLKLTGFKSFVDANELRIDPGLTGVIGPNGCGKSNLLEALRWVMGATSAKSLRGSGMEDVIFAGTDARAAREHAEVKLSIDNTDRTAPAQFNDAELLEVVRRITRGKGSHYKINGEDVRAKDVQLLFADAGTGANSPALVRQGQISELINAKPENRRRVLEEAAGISGLRARRREAQLRLNAAEANLERLQEVVENLDARFGALQRQAKQAGRYKELSGKIRSFEALLWLRRLQEARQALNSAEEALTEVDAEAEKAIVAAAVATKASEAALNQVQPLREKEAEAAAALRHAERVRDQLERDLTEAKDSIERLTTRGEELSGTLEREAELHREAEAALKRLRTQLSKLEEEARQDSAAQERASAVLVDADRSRGEAEKRLDEANSQCANIRARRENARRQLEAAERRLEQVSAEEESAQQALDAFSVEDAPALKEIEALISEGEKALTATLDRRETAQRTRDEARADLETRRETRRSAASALASLEAEQSSLERLLATSPVQDQALEQVRAQSGFEQALAAALGDDLEASLDETAPRRWAASATQADALPAGCEPLSKYVEAPKALAARLDAIGVVDEGALDECAAALRPGQRLVTHAGALRRWDGYSSEAGAPSSAAVRLETRNRLDALRSEREERVEELEATKSAEADAEAVAQEADRALSAAQEQIKQAEAELRHHEQGLAKAQAEAARAEARSAGLKEALERARSRRTSSQSEADQARAEAEAAEKTDDGAEELSTSRERAERARGAAADARAALETARREAQGRRHRIAALEREQSDWARRESSASERVTNLRNQIESTAKALKSAKAKPAELESQRPVLLDALSDAETAASAARETVAAAEMSQREADSTLRAAERLAADAREARAAAHARLVAAQERVEETEARLHDATGESLETLEQRGENSEFNVLSSDEIERRLDEARLARDRLGAVNLRADDEAEELDAERQHLKTERDDLTEAVARLRKAVDTLSREGRARLVDAFEVVDGHFQRLFQTLFGGGRAELALTESEDPLEAGLEIYACPPGKKMETMSLMSGGEQALTATALIFAVFLSNPAPVCVLDEVDAPLDDANVDRYCTMLDEMKTLTETRFLVITHNPVTMSRMDRLFGVTMGERGISQLVSVSLRNAEALLAAE